MIEEVINVLYVDDESCLLEIGKLFLEENGCFEVDTTMYPKEAINLIKKNGYEAIISDYQMPGMNGIELLKTVRQEFPDLPFILFTGKGREEIVIEAINTGATFYLQKGGNPEAQFAELAHKVISAVKTERQRVSAEKRMTDLSSLLFKINKGEEEDIKAMIMNASRWTGAQAGYIAYVHTKNDKKELMIHESWGLETEEFKKMIVPFEKNNKDEIMCMGPKVLDSMKGLIVNDYLESEAIKHIESVDKAVAIEKIKSAMAVPIISEKEDEKGIFYVFTKDPNRKFNKGDLKVLFMAAGFIDMVIQKKKARLEKERTEKKLSLMRDIARHAIRNYATVILMSLSMLLEIIKEEKIREQLLKMQFASEKLIKEIGNVEAYQKIGVNNPKWFAIAKMIERASKEYPTLIFEDFTSGLEICVDPIVETIFKNFIENTLVHGKKATKIILEYNGPMPNGNLILYYRDNGVGVETEMKEKIFKYGFGSNSTFDLFFAREVFKITGIEIREVGIPEEGVCFEITIPRGLYNIKK